MATTFNFNGKKVKLPGVYSAIKSGVNNAPSESSYGNVLIIDNDADALFGGGAGVSGEYSQGKDSIYGFDQLNNFRSFIGGGKVWDIAQPLFRPFGGNSNGVAKLWYIRALTTTGAQDVMTFANSTITIAARHEGIVGNGILNTANVLYRGLGWTISAGTTDTAKYIFTFYRGTYVGDSDIDNRSLNGISLDEAKPTVVAISDEVANSTELHEWMADSADFNNHFKDINPNLAPQVFTAADITSNVGYQILAGGTQSAGTIALEAVFDAIADLDYTHILSIDSGSAAFNSSNVAILDHLETDARFEKFLVVGGGRDKDTFATHSINSATNFDSQKVIVVHGAIEEIDITSGIGLREKSSLQKAAYVLGRAAGLEPQTPVTFKGLGYAGEIHKLNKKEKEQGLNAGVITTYWDTDIQSFVITQGINTLKKNKYLVNSDGTSHSWQLMRIAAQLNKELEINAKIQLLGDQSQGPNRNTLNEEVVRVWIEKFLRRKTATRSVDNLIISFQDVVVTVEQDAYCISYGFEPNFEVNKLFITGFILDPNS